MSLSPATISCANTGAIVTALVTALQGVQLPISDGQPAAAAFDRVEQFDCEDIVAAFQFLLISQKRVAIVVPLDEEFEEVTDVRKLIMRRTLPVMVLISDRVLGDRKAALYGNANTPGAFGLLWLAMPSLAGILIPNPNGVIAKPHTAKVLALKDKAQQQLPSRLAVGLELHCRGGKIEAPYGNGPIW